MNMANYGLKNKARIAFLLSLILHLLLILILGLFLLQQPHEGTKESVTVDITRSLRQVSPPRRIALRSNILDSRQIMKQAGKEQLRPKPMMRENINLNFTRQSMSAQQNADIPDVTTSAERLRSEFDMPLSKAVGSKVAKSGTDTKRSFGNRNDGGIGVPTGGGGIFETALYWIARNLISKNKTGKEDIVFIIDASGSMEENIAAVARYISKMIEVFKESKLDYTIGVIKYNRILKTNDVKIYEQTKDASEIRSILRAIKCDGDERTLDAIETGINQVKYRNSVDKTFILVTDESFTPRTATRQNRPEITLRQMLVEDFQAIMQMCKDKNIKVSILGVNDEMQKTLTKETEGLWFQIPQSENAF
jgi:hypothetical protein